MSWICPLCGALNRPGWATCALCRRAHADAPRAVGPPAPQPETIVSIPLIDLEQRRLAPDVPYPPQAPPPQPRPWPGLGRLGSADHLEGEVEHVVSWIWRDRAGEGRLRAVTAPLALLLHALGVQRGRWVSLALEVRVPEHDLITVRFDGRLLADLPAPPALIYAEGTWRAVRQFEAMRIACIAQFGLRHWIAAS